jgi:phosphocarrier protein
MGKKQAKVEITNSLGFHARPCALFVQTASQHKKCDVRVIKDGVVVDGKSIMGLMMLAAAQGTIITIEVEGDDSECESALASLVELIENKFGEE